MAEIDIDEADVLVLREGLGQITLLASKINNSLGRIASTTNESSKLFAPIVSTNTSLNILQRNIESSLDSISSIKDLANDASKHEIVLSGDISQVGLKQYIKAIHKVDDILDDINNGEQQEQNPSEFHGIVTHLTQLIYTSEQKLQLLFMTILNKIEPFDPQINMNKKIPFPYYEDEDLSQLTQILDYFDGMGKPTVADILSKQRSELILKCLAFLEPFTKQITSNENAPYQKGSSGIINYTEALIGFIANENALVEDLYLKQPENQSITFSKIIQPVLNSYVKIIKSNISLVESNISNVGLFSFELNDNVTSVLRVLRGKNLEDYPPLVSCTSEIKSISQSLYKDLIQYIGSKGESMTQLPTDSGVTEATVDAMSRLRKFSDYRQGCSNSIQGMARDYWLPRAHNDKEFTLQGKLNTQDPVALLSCFFSDCIDILIVSLEKRAQRILMPHLDPDIANPNSTRNTHKQRIGFFLMTNITLIEQIVQRSDISSVLGELGRDRLEKLKKRYMNYFVSDWRDLTSNLLDSLFVDSSGKISSKDKDQIKEKFKKFNDGFEDLVSKFKHYRISDPAMKKLLKTEVISLVMPMYERFYGRYKDSFKNPRKHIKYTPGELMSVLNSLGR